MNSVIGLLICMIGLFSIFCRVGSCESEPIDGTYDAQVTTDSGTYSVPVEVENGEVSAVEWPNGGRMHISGADLDSDDTSGVNSRGDSIDIEVEDLERESDSLNDDESEEEE